MTISFLWIGIRNNGKRFYCFYREPLLLILKTNPVFYSWILDSTSSLGSRLTIQVSIVCGGISVATSPTSSRLFCCSSVSLKKDALLALFRSKLQQRLTHPYTSRSVEWWMSMCVNERVFHVGKRSIPRDKKEKKTVDSNYPSLNIFQTAHTNTKSRTSSFRLKHGVIIPSLWKGWAVFSCPPGSCLCRQKLLPWHLKRFNKF